VILTPKPNLADSAFDSLSDHGAEDAFDGDFAADDAFEIMAPITLELTPDACGHRLDKVIAQLVPQYSRSRLQLWLEAGFVTVDGKVAKRNMTAYGDEKIVILPQSAPEDEAFKPEAMELNIVHEDEHIIVINKPAGLVVHPGPGNWSGTLLNGLLHHCPQLAGVPRAGIVHRLDKDTSGLMVVGKTLASKTDLVHQLLARTVKR
jgi:23S rRNA pseudouridine1911/1915/1917 synthase